MSYLTDYGRHSNPFSGDFFEPEAEALLSTPEPRLADLAPEPEAEALLDTPERLKALLEAIEAAS